MDQIVAPGAREPLQRAEEPPVFASCAEVPVVSRGRLFYVARGRESLWAPQPQSRPQLLQPLPPPPPPEPMATAHSARPLPPARSLARSSPVQSSPVQSSPVPLAQPEARFCHRKHKHWPRQQVTICWRAKQRKRSTSARLSAASV